MERPVGYVDIAPTPYGSTALSIRPRICHAASVESYPEDVWEHHKAEIHRLYMKNELKEVMRIMRDQHHFKPSIKMYKTHITSWGIFKNNRKKVSRQPINQYYSRQIQEISRKDPAQIQEAISRYKKRNMVNTDLPLVGTEVPSSIWSHGLPFASDDASYTEAMLLVMREWNQLFLDGQPTEKLLDLIAFAETMIIGSITNFLELGYILCGQGEFGRGGEFIRQAFLGAELLVQVATLPSPLLPLQFWRVLQKNIPKEIVSRLIKHTQDLALVYLPHIPQMGQIMKALSHLCDASSSRAHANWIALAMEGVFEESAFPIPVANISTRQRGINDEGARILKVELTFNSNWHGTFHGSQEVIIGKNIREGAEILGALVYFIREMCDGNVFQSPLQESDQYITE